MVNTIEACSSESFVKSPSPKSMCSYTFYLALQVCLVTMIWLSGLEKAGASTTPTSRPYEAIFICLSTAVADRMIVESHAKSITSLMLAEVSSIPEPVHLNFRHCIRHHLLFLSRPMQFLSSVCLQSSTSLKAASSRHIRQASNQRTSLVLCSLICSPRQWNGSVTV